MRHILTFILITLSVSVYAQSQSTEPAYLRYPGIPDFSMTTPSGKIFTNKDLDKNKPTLFFLFSVDCEHCMHETEKLTQNIDKFKGTQIVMITPFHHKDMVAYYRGYFISKYPEITMGSDTTRRLNLFFNMHYFPGLYVYKKGKLVYHFEGTQNIDTLVHYLKP